MPTLAQLQAEVWWGREFIPPTLNLLIGQLRFHWKVPNSAIGCKGDENHLRGYHRSRNWIKSSFYCTNRTYSVTETPGNISGGNPDWLCGVDISLPQVLLLPMCRRLDEGVRSGKYEKVTEWYGNVDGDQRVDGYNNILNKVATSDSSHLWHAHISLDRAAAGEQAHDDLFRLLTGAEEVPTEAEIWAFDVVRTAGISYRADDAVWEARQHAKAANEVRLPQLKGLVDELNLKVVTLDSKVDQILTLLQQGIPVPGEVVLSDESVDDVAEAVANEQAARQAE